MRTGSHDAPFDEVAPTAIDLFSGCGGTTLGLVQAGFDVVAGVEIDPLARKAYELNHPAIPLWDDVCQVDVPQLLARLKRKSGQIDLVVGCPPCQAHSALARLNGGRYIRNPENKDLVFELLRIVEGVNPKIVMIENVPRLAEEPRFRKVLRKLREVGYVGQPTILNARDYGVPQRRLRMVYIGSRIGEVSHAAPLSLRRCVRDAIADLLPAGISGDPLHDFPETRSKKVAALINSIPRDGGSRAALPARRQLACHRRCDGFKDVYGRMAWADPAPTITGGCVNPSKGRFLHPTENRTITLREAALLQSFPSDYAFPLDRGKFAVAQLIGNAFPPEFVRLQGETIIDHLRCRQRRRTPT
ncbi:putative BsuMI modification methylase subunit YdiO [Caulifigura coniformis]|uniref:DNA (cytosine-5-)-methyltransferase n=1 Tax=Caulifigura coniformis TaxID=2527983 RepID=A0A517SES0_9PLAN|nr:DNA cytosine methyltransferase [Caulifigura coniformis]QDT54624.1 putative BsuMI modification methylase subunit YdiO [Caulifigura coniformis]